MVRSPHQPSGIGHKTGSTMVRRHRGGVPRQRHRPARRPSPPGRHRGREEDAGAARASPSSPSSSTICRADGNKLYERNNTIFTMHDLVHDLATLVMADEFNLAGPNCRYAQLTNCTKQLKSSPTSPEKLRALHIVYCDSWPYRFSHDAYSSVKYIRVLDLSRVRCDELPDSIGQLKQLRYLSAPSIHDGRNLRCTSTLQKLNYLNLRYCRILPALPESIGEMKGLMHLDLSYCESLTELPHSFAKLKELVYLDLSYNSHVVGIPEALTDLTKLQYLGLSGCENLRVLPEVIGNLTELRCLKLSHCIYHIFDMSSTNQTESFIDRICRLPNMEHLDLSYNGRPLISIPESASRLRKLVLARCWGVTRLPECVAKMDCRRLFGLLPSFCVTVDYTNFTTNLGLLEDINPDELEINELENVMWPVEARSIKLSEKLRVRKLTLRWRLQSERYENDMESLMELVPPTTLQEFVIYGYRSVTFPYWLMSIGNYFPNVVKMEMSDLPNCKCLPPFSQVPNLRVLTLHNMESLEEWNTKYSCADCKLELVNIRHCPKLRIKPHLPRAASWIIENSDNVLISWTYRVSHNGASSSSSSSSTNLKVEISEVPLHQWRLFHHLPALSDLHISRCSDLTSSPEITWALQSLKSLTLVSLVQSKLPEWVRELTSLQQLVIQDRKIEEVPDNMRQLKQLQSLTLYACRSLRQLPLWFGELASLKKLVISSCDAITTLPNSIQLLTNLQALVIQSCPNLEHWCEAEENKTKLAHIEQKICGLPYISVI